MKSLLAFVLLSTIAAFDDQTTDDEGIFAGIFNNKWFLSDLYEYDVIDASGEGSAVEDPLIQSNIPVLKTQEGRNLNTVGLFFCYFINIFV